MKRYLLRILAVIGLIVISIPFQVTNKAYAWWDSDWSYRNVISFNGTGLSDNLTNFTVRVHLTASNFDFSKVNADLSDIRFVASDDSTLLNTDNSSWDPATQDAIFWVSANISNASPNYSDYMYIYYGNAGASAAWNRNAVWDNANAVSAWNLESTSANSTIIDSSSGGYTLTANNSTWSSLGYAFGGVNSYLSANAADYRIADSSGSIEAWFMTSGATATIFGSADAASNVQRVFFGTASGKLQLYVRTGGSNDQINGTTAFVDGNWHHAVISSNGTVWTVYLDGNPESVTVGTGSNNGNWFADVPSRDNVSIGALLNLTPSTYTTGKQGWTRIYSSTLSATESKAQYMNAINSLIYIGGTNPLASITTESATGISMNKDGVTSGSFAGNITDLGGAPVAVDYWWEYGLTDSYGSFSTNTTGVSTAGAKSIAIPNNLTPGQTYHNTFVVDNLYGSINGSDTTFTLTMPTVTTGTATASAGLATFNGNLDTLGVASDVYLGVEWGNTPALGNTTALDTKAATGAFTINSAVNSNTILYYRVFAQVGSEYAYGAVNSVNSPEVPTYQMLSVVIAAIFVGIIILKLMPMVIEATDGMTMIFGLLILAIFAYIIVAVIMGINSIIG